ncbi:MAG: pantoate--beta-alanine ligase, partial [Desulfobacterales bacterium]|nr:pantoate--beta-alanine ligase [Desulfobacterales bacterium]
MSFGLEGGEFIEIISTAGQMQSRAGQLKREGRTVALVPTMGYLHEGHLALMRMGRERADTLVTSIYVNPTQFAPGEDFEAYPRDMQRDLAMA